MLPISVILFLYISLSLKKGCHFYFCNIFGKCRPILITRPYLVKLECATVQLYKKVIKFNMVQ